MRRLLTDFMSVMRQLSLDELHDEALLTPTLLVVGEAPLRERVARDLFGAGAMPYVTFAEEVPSTAGARYDLVALLWSGGASGEPRRGLSSAQSLGWPTVVLSTGSVPAADAAVLPGEVVPLPAGAGEDWTAARARVVAAMDENRWLSLGRHIPELRPAVAAALLQATARANAQFAAFSNLPAVIPFVGNVVGASADFLVLTKNQLLLLYKLAAVYGRDIDERRQILLEMVPVVGAGLVWRTVARELVALAPGLLGAVPKVLIAYAGTYTVGRAAQYYYEEGRRPTKAEWDRFYGQALRRAQAVRAGLRRGRERRAGQNLTAGSLPPEPARPEGATDHTVH